MLPYHLKVVFLKAFALRNWANWAIAQKIHQLMLNFSGLTTYSKKSKIADWYKELETNFLQDAGKLFDTLYKESNVKFYMAW